MWTDFFDRIYLINLSKRTDRYFQSDVELGNAGIPYLLWPATYNSNGQQGIYDTLTSLFKHAVEYGINKILVFEDDVKILATSDDLSRILDLATLELPTNWEMLYLGANLPDPSLVTEYSAHLLKTKRALALHAVAYSRECMEMILSLPRMLPVDLQIANFVHPRGKTFITYPMLCGQREGFSDIEQREVSYKGFIEERYQTVCNHLNLQP